MTDIVTRSEWKARHPSGDYSFLSSTFGVKVHYTGGRVDPDILTDHTKCVRMVQGIQNFHMDGHGWIDIGYSMVACPHRKIFIGRGPHHLPAANGAGLNSGHYAVLGLVGNSGLVTPNDDLLLGILDAVEYLRDRGHAGMQIKGHRDGYATDCPGTKLYNWVKAGCPSPKEITTTELIMADLPELAEGSEGFDVKTVRGLLNARGFVPTELVPDASLRAWLDEVKFNSDLDDVVRKFQNQRGLAVDGIVGYKTWKALNRV